MIAWSQITARLTEWEYIFRLSPVLKISLYPIEPFLAVKSTTAQNCFKLSGARMDGRMSKFHTKYLDTKQQKSTYPRIKIDEQQHGTCSWARSVYCCRCCTIYLMSLSWSWDLKRHTGKTLVTKGKLTNTATRIQNYLHSKEKQRGKSSSECKASETVSSLSPSIARQTTTCR